MEKLEILMAEARKVSSLMEEHKQKRNDMREIANAEGEKAKKLYGLSDEYKRKRNRAANNSDYLELDALYKKLEKEASKHAAVFRRLKIEYENEQQMYKKYLNQFQILAIHIKRIREGVDNKEGQDVSNEDDVR